MVVSRSIFVVVLGLVFLQSATSQEVEKIRTCRYKGYIFPSDTTYFIPNMYSEERWTPSKQEIDAAEELVKEKYREWRELVKLKNLSGYTRQYLGYFNENGEKILWINFICGTRYRKKIRKETVIVFGGGNCFMNVRINLVEEKVFDFTVNGTS